MSVVLSAPGSLEEAVEQRRAGKGLIKGEKRNFLTFPQRQKMPFDHSFVKHITSEHLPLPRVWADVGVLPSWSGQAGCTWGGRDTTGKEINKHVCVV